MTNADQSVLILRHKHRDADLEMGQPSEVEVLIVGSRLSMGAALPGRN
jgi:hypothetical protein